MVKNNKDAYDAVIIGAGISGLVCACYLAKGGMKVLLIEQHHKTGGYCTSFKRRNFIFDAAAHSFGSYREGGIMRKILRDLDVDSKLDICRYDPSDVILAPGYKISFWADTCRTIRELQESFPHESGGISNFFHFLQHSGPFQMATLRNKTFKDLLNKFISDDRLKAILSFPILGNGGLPASLISAFTATILYTEFYLDGGYYPRGGMQALPDALAAKFTELGGKLILSCPAKKIKVDNNRTVGVVVGDGEFVPARYVISCCDARQTFLKLISSKALTSDFLSKIQSLEPSPSFFIGYLGTDGLPLPSLEPGASVWVMPDYKIEELYGSYIKQNSVDSASAFMLRIPPDNKSLQAFIIAPFKNRQYWSNNKRNILESFVARIDRIFPGLSSHIKYLEAATPYTLYRYTFNYEGAAYGWASTPLQLFTQGLMQKTSIENLYLAGHWTTQTQGISGAAYIGDETAKLVLKKEKAQKARMPS
jgi:phytoene dehydrogenase-like protein